MTYSSEYRPAFHGISRLALQVVLTISLPLVLILGAVVGVFMAANQWRKELAALGDEQ
jgi:flagellar biosynthesis protein FliQ